MLACYHAKMENTKPETVQKLRQLTEEPFVASASCGFGHCSAPSDQRRVLSLFIAIGEQNESTDHSFVPYSQVPYGEHLEAIQGLDTASVAD